MMSKNWSDCVKLYEGVQSNEAGITSQIQDIKWVNFSDFTSSFKRMNENHLEEQVQAVREVLKTSPHQKTVDLCRCDLGEVHLKVLLEVFSCLELDKFDISGNENISPEGWLKIGRLVRQCGLNTLCALECNLNDNCIKSLGEGMNGTKLTELNISGNNNISPEGWLKVGCLVEHSGLKLLYANKCNVMDHHVDKLVQGMNGAKLDSLYIDDFSCKLLYFPSLLNLLPHVNDTLDLSQWKINEAQRSNLQQRLNQEQLTGLTVLLHDHMLKCSPKTLPPTLAPIENVEAEQDGNTVLVTWNSLPSCDNLFYYVVTVLGRKTVERSAITNEARHRIWSVDLNCNYCFFVWGFTNDSISKFASWCKLKTADIRITNPENQRSSVNEASLGIYDRKRKKAREGLDAGEIRCQPKKAKLLNWQKSAISTSSEKVMDKTASLWAETGYSNTISSRFSQKEKAAALALSSLVTTDPDGGTSSTSTEKRENASQSVTVDERVSERLEVPGSLTSSVPAHSATENLTAGLQSFNSVEVSSLEADSPIVITQRSISTNEARLPDDYPALNTSRFPRNEEDNLNNPQQIQSTGVSFSRNPTSSVEDVVSNGNTETHSQTSHQFEEASSSGIANAPYVDTRDPHIMMWDTSASTSQYPAESFTNQPLTSSSMVYTSLRNVNSPTYEPQFVPPTEAYAVDQRTADVIAMPDVTSTSIDYPLYVPFDLSAMENRMARLEGLVTSLQEENANKEEEMEKLEQEIMNLKQDVARQQQEISSLKELPGDSNRPTETGDLDRIREFILPMRNAEHVKKNEKLLEDRENVKRLVSFLVTLGGTNKKDVIWRIMKQLFSNELAVTYSWEGRKGKNAFCKLNVADVVRESSKRNKIKEARTEKLVMTWLKNASDRGGGRKKREERKQEKRLKEEEAHTK